MTEWGRWILATMLFGWLTIASPAHHVPAAAAQEPVTESRQKFDLAIGTWISTGDTRWSHNASSSSPLLGNPTSKLTYKDVGTNVFDLAGTYWLTPQLFGRLNIGVAGIGGGRLTDDDYLSADGGNPSSRTISNLNGNGMVYLNADIGRRVKSFADDRGWLDVFGGFQFWRTQYSAVGLGQVICTPAGATINLGGGRRLCNPAGPSPPVSSGTTVITNTTNWYSIRLGGRAEYRLTGQLSVQLNAALLPISIVENKDVHHLRSDLQNPSISMLGVGIGADADASAKFMFTKNVGLNVGYRVWWNRTYDGTVTFHNTGAPSDSFPLTQFQSLRHGLTAGLNITF